MGASSVQIPPCQVLDTLPKVVGMGAGDSHSEGAELLP